LLCGWTQQPAVRIEPRLALQAVHEAALCLKGVRERRYVAMRGFEVLNGLPFLATDKTMSSLYGPVPVAFVILQPGAAFATPERFPRRPGMAAKRPLA